MPERPALRYHGGKWRIASWIIGHFPEHRAYVEPYAGGASVLLQKPPAEVDVYNDLSGRVSSFFRVLRERPDELVRVLELTPYARAEINLARGTTDDELEAARRLFILSWQGRGGPTAQWNTGWRFQREVKKGSSVISQWNDIEHLYQVAARFKSVQIECDSALNCIRRFDAPGTLFYCDPPYVTDTRSKWRERAYDHEMTDNDHCELATCLRSISGMAVVSGYPSPLYMELYADWKVVHCETLTDAMSVKTECLWLSPHAVEFVPQANMFDFLEA